MTTLPLVSSWIADSQSPAVVPVLIGPMATFLAILPQLLLGMLLAVVAALKPSGMKKIVLFFWHQWVFTLCLVAVIGGTVYAYQAGLFFGDESGHVGDVIVGREWTAFRGGAARDGVADNAREPTTGQVVWRYSPRIGSKRIKTFYSSPTIVGNRLYVSSALQDPFNDVGGVHCVDADTGGEVWKYTGDSYRASFSSPSVVYQRNPDGSENKDEGYVVCGEGLHFTNDAQIVCLTLAGEKLWSYRLPDEAGNHFESSACIADGRVYIGAGEAGYFCFALEPEKPGEAKILWRLHGRNYRDCESSPIVVDGVCYVGLGDDKRQGGGRAILAVDAATGKELWRVGAPFPVFGSPTVAEGKLFIGMGWGDFINDAGQLRNLVKDELRKEGRADGEIESLTEEIKPGGQVWCLDLANRKAGRPPEVLWKFTEPKETILGTIAYLAPPLPPGHKPDAASSGGDAEAKPPTPPPGLLYFGSRDETFYCLSAAGTKLGQFDARSPMVTSPAIGKKYIYLATTAGAFYCLLPRLTWSAPAEGLTWPAVESVDFVQAWATSLGGGSMFFSSPALARGHVYIGTETSGLLSIGTLEPIRPRWQSGQFGGVADLSAVPAIPDFYWSTVEDPGEAAKFQASAPLMPLPETLTRADVDRDDPKQADRFIYAPITRNGQPMLVKYRLAMEVRGSGGKREQPHAEIWAAPLDMPVKVAPAGVGNDLFVVVGDGKKAPILRRFSAIDHRQIEQVTLDADASGLLAVSGNQLYIAAGASRLMCLRIGEPLTPSMQSPAWSRPFDEKLIGVPLARDGFLVVCTEQSVRLLDGLSGRDIWVRPMKSQPRFGPVGDGDGLLIGTESGLTRLNLLTGRETFSYSAGPAAQPPLPIKAGIALLTGGAEAGNTRLHLLDRDEGQPVRLPDHYYLDLPAGVLAKLTEPEAPKVAETTPRERLLLKSRRGTWTVDTERGEVKLFWQGGAWYFRALGANTYLKTAEGWTLLDYDGRSSALVKMPGGYCRVHSTGGVDQIVSEADSEKVQVGNWYRRDIQRKLLHVVPTKGGWKIPDPAAPADERKGRTLKLTPDGAYVKVDKVKLVQVTRRLTPVGAEKDKPVKLDTGFMPVAATSGVLFLAEGNLAQMPEPEFYRGPTGPTRPLPPRAPGNSDDGQAAPQPVDVDLHEAEAAEPEVKSWFESDWLGRPLTPMVIAGGRAYLATSQYGLVCLKQD